MVSLENHLREVFPVGSVVAIDLLDNENSYGLNMLEGFIKSTLGSDSLIIDFEDAFTLHRVLPVGTRFTLVNTKSYEAMDGMVESTGRSGVVRVTLATESGIMGSVNLISSAGM